MAKSMSLHFLFSFTLGRNGSGVHSIVLMEHENLRIGDPRLPGGGPNPRFVHNPRQPGGGLPGCPRNLRNQLGQLLPSAVAHVHKSDSDGVLVQDCLAYATYSKGQPMQIEFSLDAHVNSHIEALIGSYPASSHTQIEDAPRHGDCGL